MVKVITLIPTYRNGESPEDENRVPVSEEELNGFIQEFYTRFGGVTIAGRTQGHWIDPDDGKLYSDICLQVFTLVEDSRIHEVEELVMRIGRQLEQVSMYFEVQTPIFRYLNTK